MKGPSTRRCDVVIPVKDSVWWVDWCLAELFRTTGPSLLGKVVVVDDGSTPDSVAVLSRICERYPGVLLTRNAGRPGFGGACNHGVALTDAAWFLLLNTDCLLTPRAVEKLVTAMERDPTIGLASPISNNSPALSLPMSPGCSYVDMNELLERAAQGRSPEQVAVEACTIVGNCLLVSRRCWEATGDFDALWGAGYGEETDLQFRAMEQGFRGVALTNTYVFHFGSATFRYRQDLATLRERALALFHSKWGAAYQALQEKCRPADPVEIAVSRLDGLAQTPLECDVLFVLPGVAQGIGGIHAVLDTANWLVRSGRRVACAILGPLDTVALERFAEPILFGLLSFPELGAFLAARLRPRLVVATLFTTTLPAWTFARRIGVPVANWIQGYEYYFENGQRWPEVELANRAADAMLVTSPWLEEGVRRHTPDTPLWRVPVGANPDQFFPPAVAEPSARLRLGIVLRAAPDKGQWILLEVLQRLASQRQRISLLVLASDPYVLPMAWMGDPEPRITRLPLDRERVAEALRGCDVLLDASFHEGFGLLPLEAMMSGATVIVSNSGGVTGFVRDGVNGIVVPQANDPGCFADAVQSLLDDPARLARLKAAAVQAAARFQAQQSHEQYAAALQEIAATPVRPEAAPVFATGQAQGYAGIEAARDALVVRQSSIRMTMTGPDPRLLLAPVPPGAASIVARVEITVVEDTAIKLYAPVPRPSDPGVSSGLRRAVRHALGRQLPPAYAEAYSTSLELRPGPYVAYLGLAGPFGPDPLRFDPATAPGECLLSALEVRAVESLSRDASPERLRRAFEGSDRTFFGERLDPGDLVPLGDVTLTRAGGGIRTMGPRPAVLLPEAAPCGEPQWLTLELFSPGDTFVRLESRSEDVSAPGRLLAAGWSVLGFLIPPNAGRLCLDLGTALGWYRLENVVLRGLAAAPGPVLRPPVS